MTLVSSHKSDILRKSIPKTTKNIHNPHNNKDSSCKKLSTINGGTSCKPHPSLKYLYGTTPSADEQHKFAKLLYQGMRYAVCSL